MSGFPEISFTKAAMLGGSAGTAVAAAKAVHDSTPTFAGMSPEQWALIGYVLAASYTATLFLLLTPKMLAAARCLWRKVSGWFRRADDSDQAGA